MNYFNEPTEKTGYLEQDFRLFHIKDQTKRDFSYHYHEFHTNVLYYGSATTSNPQNCSAVFRRRLTGVTI